jgi:hypothetical protein
MKRSYPLRLAGIMLILAVLLGIATECQAQVDTTRFYITHHKDVMTGKEYYVASMRLICRKDERIGFGIQPTFKNVRGKPSYTGLSVISAGIGTCVQNSELIFLFEDGTKVSTKSWNDFNCKGDSYFDLNSSLLNKIAKPLKAIRFMDGRSYESYTHEVPVEDKNYFVDVKAALDQSLIVADN